MGEIGATASEHKPAYAGPRAWPWKLSSRLRLQASRTSARAAWATDRDLQRRIRRTLQELGVQPPLDVDELRRALSERRGRPIVLRPAPLPMPGPLGMWVDTVHGDLIVYQERTSKLHQDHIILHELCHVIADDDGAPTDWAALVPGVDKGEVRRVLNRCSYDDVAECRVETAATIIMEWASVLDRLEPAPARDLAARRVCMALGDRRGWL
jgi:hypothetical protein